MSDNVVNKREKTIKVMDNSFPVSIARKDGAGNSIIDRNNFYFKRNRFFDLYTKAYGNDYPPIEIHKSFKVFQSACKEWMENFLRIPDFNSRSTSFLNGLQNIPWNDHGIPDKIAINKQWADRIKETPLERLVQSSTLRDNEEAPGSQMQAWMTNLDGSRYGTNTFIHALMVLCEKSDDTEMPVPYITDGSHIQRIIKQINFNPTNESFSALSDRPYTDLKVSKSVDKGDVAHVKDFSERDRDLLSKRGVQAKSYKKKRKTDPAISPKELNKDFNLDALENYLGSPFEMNESGSYASQYDLDDGNGASFTHKWFNEVANYEIAQALEFRDRVIAEVNANSSRNQEEDKFIIRKILGYKAYVIIKPTSLGSVNNPKPVFYSVVFRGRQYNEIFETVHDGGGGWMYTDFISTSRIRSSHEMNTLPQFIMMIAENFETLGRLREEFCTEQFAILAEPIKWCLLAHLSDTEEYSSVTSNFRYYYFSLFTGFKNCINEADRLAEKLPKVVRDPLLLLALRRLIEYHEDLDSDKISQQTSVLSQKQMEKDLNEQDSSDNEHDRLPTVKTPFGFEITNARTFLKAAYMSIYHNKDEAERGPAAKQIVSKLAKQEKHMTKLLRSDETPDNWDRDIGKPLDIYQFNARACIMGVDLLKKKLLDQAGIPRKDFRRFDGFDEWIEETIILPTLLRSTYDKLASTKSSYVDNGEIKVSQYNEQKGKRKCEYEDDEGNEIIVGETIKCLEAVISMRKKGTINGMSPSDDVFQLMTEFKNEGSKFVIKIFKKNQLTGVREIYILTIIGRCLQRIIEDLARAICNEVHEEKLTGPETKDAFVSEHRMEQSARAEGKESVTLNGSGDKTQWANYLQARTVTLPLFRLLPKKYHPLIAHIANANTKKEIEIPAALMESIINHPETDLEDMTLNEIKSAVLTPEFQSEIASFDSSRLHCKGNTMQGIFHYCSSLMHLCALCLLEQMIHETVRDMGFESVVSFEVSSDDKGFMVSVMISADRNVNILNLVIQLTSELSYLERVIDSCWGIRDSKLKSVTTITVAFEFNSVFYFGNSITTPLAKFTCRCCDDSVQSTLHQRVSSMYSSVRQIRDNGGSGILCSIATMCQHIVMKTNLGFKRYSWFDDTANICYNSFKLSHTGYRRICSPITAGLAMVDFENQKWVSKKRLGNVYKILLRRDLDSEDVSEVVLKLGNKLWSDEQHKAMLQRLSLEPHEVTKEESLLILTNPKTAQELNMKLELMACSASLSRSFVQAQRSDLSRAGMYLLWHKAFKWNDEQLCFRDLVVKMLEVHNSDYKLGDEYSKYQVLEKKPRSYQLRVKRLRLMPRYLRALVSEQYTRDDVVEFLRSKWLDEPDNLENYLKDQITAECTWITNTSDEFFDNHDPIMLHRFINSIPTRRIKMKLLSRGSHYASNPIDAMMKDNTCADCTTRFAHSEIGEDMIKQAEDFAKLVAARVSRWVDLLSLSNNDETLSRICWYDLKTLSLLHNDIQIEHCQSRQQRLCIYLMSRLKNDSPISAMRFHAYGTSITIPVICPNERPLRTYFTRNLGHTVRYRKNRENHVVDYNCASEQVAQQIKKYERYRRASYGLISCDVEFIINRVEDYNYSLQVVGSGYKMSGITGTPGLSNSEKHRIYDPTAPLDQSEWDLLNEYFSSDAKFSGPSQELLMQGHGPLCRAIRSVLYWSRPKMGRLPLRRTTEDRRDSELTTMDRTDPSEILNFDGIQSLLEFMQPAERVSSVGTETEKEVTHMDNYIEQFDTDADDRIPGMEADEFATKELVDRPRCIQSMRDALESVMRMSVETEVMFRSSIDFYNLITDENVQETDDDSEEQFGFRNN